MNQQSKSRERLLESLNMDTTKSRAEIDKVPFRPRTGPGVMMLTIKLETLLNEAESELAAITGGTFVPNTQMRSIARLESLLAESKAKLAAMQNGPQ